MQLCVSCVFNKAANTKNCTLCHTTDKLCTSRLNPQKCCTESVIWALCQQCYLSSRKGLKFTVWRSFWNGFIWIIKQNPPERRVTPETNVKLKWPQQKWCHVGFNVVAAGAPAWLNSDFRTNDAKGAKLTQSCFRAYSRFYFVIWSIYYNLFKHPEQMEEHTTRLMFQVIWQLLFSLLVFNSFLWSHLQQLSDAERCRLDV